MRNPKDVQEEVGTRVGVLLRNAGGTYVAAGAEADLSPATISAWNRGLRGPRPDSLRKLQQAS